MGTFGQRLREARRRANLTQGGLAALLGSQHRVRVYRYEAGLQNPSRETLIKLSEVLHVSLDWLVKGETN